MQGEIDAENFVNGLVDFCRLIFRVVLLLTPTHANTHREAHAVYSHKSVGINTHATLGLLGSISTAAPCLRD